MLRLLIDEHISPEVAEGFRREVSNAAIMGLPEWENGQFLGAPDDIILEAAAAQRLTLVTYDLKTIPPLLKNWIETGRNHGGVIFVDGRTIAPSDIGGLVRALVEFATQPHRELKNAVFFLKRRSRGN
jgi:hypothetical protein